MHGGGGLADPGGLLRESADRFREAFRVHVRGRFVVMSFQAQLTKLAESAGRPELVVRLLAGLGGVTDTDVADDLWLVGAGQLPWRRGSGGVPRKFIRRHGFHGPLEGNVAGTSWREDPDSVLAMAKAMAARPADQRPRQREAATVAARQEAIAEFKAALPRSKQASVGLLCGAATRAVRTLEVGKASFLMALDGGRAATRAIGRKLPRRGALRRGRRRLLPHDRRAAGADSSASDVMDLIRFRRERRAEYRRYELPLTFTGVPEPTVRAEDVGGAAGDVLTGVAGAPGSHGWDGPGRGRPVRRRTARAGRDPRLPVHRSQLGPAVLPGRRPRDRHRRGGQPRRHRRPRARRALRDRHRRRHPAHPHR